MGGEKLSVRQKMINMMYLVLTALLALNVSKSILDAFVKINESLEVTVEGFEHKTEFLYDEFKKANGENPDKVGPFYKVAMEVKEKANNLVKHIDELKVHLIKETDGVPQEVADTLPLEAVSAKDNYDIPSYILIGDDPANPKSGKFTAVELKEKIDNLRKDFFAIKYFNDEDKKILKERLSLDTKDFGMINGTYETWITGNFEHVPLAAVITTLTKIQADVRNAEADVIKLLFEKITAGSIPFNKIEAASISPSNYVLQNDTFRASVFLAAYDSTQSPNIYYGKIDTVKWKEGKRKPEEIFIGEKDKDWFTIPVKNGKGILKIPATQEGMFVYTGLIELKTTQGTKYFKYQGDYQVAKPSVTISPTKMNVFYIGVDNPVSISAAGVPADKIKATMTNGTIIKKGKEWIVRPKKQGKSKITVMAEINGKSKRLGDMEFRNKVIPNPVPYIANKTGSAVISKAELMATSYVVAKMENFDFDIKVLVRSFQMGLNYKGQYVEEKASGYEITSKMKKYIKTLSKGQKVFFEKIKVKLPDGTVRTIGPISFTII